MKKSAVLLIGLLVAALAVVSTGCGGEESTPTAAGTVPASPTPEPVTLRMVTSSPSGSVGGNVFFRFADLVGEYTDGQVQVDIYPGSQLLPATEEWEAVATGSVDVFADSTYYMRTSVPDVMVFFMDGSWESYEHAYAVLEDSEFPRILDEKTEQAAPVKMLGLIPTVMSGCVLNTVRETRQLSDLEGFRTQGSPGQPQPPIYDYTGMVSVPVAFEEIPTAFIQGVIDAVYLPPTAIRDLGLQETGKYALCRNFMFAVSAIVMNRAAWQSLPDDVRDTITNRVMPEVYEFAKTSYREDEEAALAALEAEVDTLHWITAEDDAAYLEWVPTHPVWKVQMLMVDPRLVEIIDRFRPSNR